MMGGMGVCVFYAHKHKPFFNLQFVSVIAKFGVMSFFSFPSGITFMQCVH